jgi:hypothetical protein
MSACELKSSSREEVNFSCHGMAEKLLTWQNYIAITHLFTLL